MDRATIEIAPNWNWGRAQLHIVTAESRKYMALWLECLKARLSVRDGWRGKHALRENEQQANDRTILFERSKEIYEDFPGCPNPPLVSFENTIDASFMAGLLPLFGVVNTPFSRLVMKLAFQVGGFSQFVKT